MKILRGSYPPLNPMYSKGLRSLISKPLKYFKFMLIAKMLSIKPSQRPTIVDVINNSFLKKRVIAYFNKWLSGPLDLEPADIEDVR